MQTGDREGVFNNLKIEKWKSTLTAQTNGEKNPAFAVELVCFLIILTFHVKYLLFLIFLLVSELSL
jgi:hypothetical protein